MTSANEATYRAIRGAPSLLLTVAFAAVTLSSLPGCAKATSDSKPPATRPPAARTYKELAATAAVTECSALANVSLRDLGGEGSNITSASELADGTRRICQVEATLAPSINIQVNLPIETWTQRYMQVGCGGLCGNIQMRPGAADGCVPLEAGGFVIAATDMGHQGMGGSFGRDPQKRADFAYRAQHLTARVAKKLTQVFYGKAPAYSYFNGCSDGGREALIEAQRFPDDFDGILAGAPAMLFQVQNSLHHAWLALANTSAAGKPILVASRLSVLHQAVLKACDELDGEADGLLADPRLCTFDPATVQCPASTQDTSMCLTTEEVAAASKIYAGPHDEASGQRLLVGGPQFGSELNWAGVFVPMDGQQGIFSEKIALDSLKNLIFETPPADDYSIRDLKFEAATYELLRTHHPLLDATNPDLSAFADKGGKLILWHGWSDQHISPINTIAYQEAIDKTMGSDHAKAFQRLYLFAGMAHCGGGQGPSSFDLLTPLMNWVERGDSPDAIVAKPASGPASGFGLPGGGRDAGPPGGRRDGDPPRSHTAMPPRGSTPPADMPSGRMQPPETMASTRSAAPASASKSRLVCPYPSIAKRVTGSGILATGFECGPALYTASTPDWVGKDFFSPYLPREH